MSFEYRMYCFLLFLALILWSFLFMVACTVSCNFTNTVGTANDVVDEDQKVTPTLEVPLKL